MKNKILHISARADYGGGPNYMNSMIHNLSSDFEFYLACPNDKPFYDQWKQHNRVKDIYILPHRKFTFKHLYFLSKFIKKHNIVLVQANGKGAGVYARLLKLLSPKIKVVFAYRGFHIYDYNSFQRNLYFIYERMMSYLTDKIINVSKGEQNLCLKHHVFKPEKSICIYNGIAPLKTKKNTELINKHQGKFIITTLTRFDFAKNMDFMYELAKLLRKEKIIKFIWIGDGEDKARLEERAKQDNVNNVEFVGIKNKDEIQEYFNISNLYLSTSRWEGLPFALIEACSAEIPIIASNVTGNNEVCINDVNGLLFELDDISSAKEAILKVFNNSELLLKYKNQSNKVFQENFTLDKMIFQHEKLYNSLLYGA